MDKEIILALKQRAKEMLDDDYSRKIGAEEIYTIICEWENAIEVNEEHQKLNGELQEKIKKLESGDINMYQEWMKKYDKIVENDTKPEIIIKDNELKEQIWDLIHEYSTPQSNNTRYITNDNLQRFFEELLKLI